MSESGIKSLLDQNDDDSFIDPEMLMQQVLNDPKMVQHITRTRQDGCETIVAYFRLSFEPNQQRQVLHLPFTPPLTSIPSVSAEVVEQQDGRVRITDVQKFGVRAEIILPMVDDHVTCRLIEVTASESPS